MKCRNTSDDSISIEDKREPGLHLNKQSWVANTHLWMKRHISATIISPPRRKTDLSPVASKACAAGGVPPTGNLEISHCQKRRYQLPLGERRETAWKSSSQGNMQAHKCTLTLTAEDNSESTVQTSGLFTLTTRLGGAKDQMLHENKE